MAPTLDAGLKLRRILLATDFSQSAQAALPQAARLARLSGASLYVAHIIEVHLWETWPELSLQQRSEAARRLDQVLALPECRGLHVQQVVRHGGVVSQVIYLAEELGIDLIVTGTRAHHGVRHLFLGSAAEKLAQRAPCTVLTVGPHARPAPEGDPGLRNIVLATALNPGASAGIAYATSFAHQHGANLWVAHSLRPGDGVMRSEAVSEWLTKVAPEQDGLMRVLEVGTVEQVTVMLAIRESADLVMLAPGLGSLLPEIVRHVACPVMTVRHAIPMIRPKRFGAEAVTRK